MTSKQSESQRRELNQISLREEINQQPPAEEIAAKTIRLAKLAWPPRRPTHPVKDWA